MESLTTWYNHKLEEAEFYRLGVMAFILLFQANIFVPVTLLAISMNDGSVIEFGICTVFSFALLVSLLGGSPARVIIPLFGVNVIVHLFIILSNFL